MDNEKLKLCKRESHNKEAPKYLLGVSLTLSLYKYKQQQAVPGFTFNFLPENIHKN
jgi:hypothetical protein